jgi:Tfp pilus assembly protein PilZ
MEVRLMEERRKALRTELDVLVNYSKSAFAPATNISEGGICIKDDKGFEPGMFITIDLRLPDSTPIRAIGKIAWCRKTDDRSFESGMEFCYIEEEDKANLRKFIEEKLKDINNIESFTQ